MVAVGNLKEVWLMEPEEIGDMAVLEGRFKRHFSHPWAGVMVGGDRPFAYQRDWDAYVAVEGLQNPAGLLTLPDLLNRLAARQAKIYRTIIG
ncbi:hypothetical protein GFC01_03035 [Desulfofundulus thermobenzoicus]|uniref:Uncharacterized protein n=1 Tax=Desulfofundulus thermobenzoicus TaxID=29376 RepID=A0A6N7IMS1_9FIRM|nr:hypothetical protein [Desulfofundulus thermobenzoicus]MQL51251.1 hypothetical protein [Desulfofundulus thermobenzoicus]HHW43302.1 hypothetical protein [Desulfotomaculum sp.]